MLSMKWSKRLSLGAHVLDQGGCHRQLGGGYRRREGRLEAKSAAYAGSARRTSRSFEGCVHGGRPDWLHACSTRGRQRAVGKARGRASAARRDFAGPWECAQMPWDRPSYVDYGEEFTPAVEPDPSARWTQPHQVGLIGDTATCTQL